MKWSFADPSKSPIEKHMGRAMLQVLGLVLPALICDAAGQDGFAQTAEKFDVSMAVSPDQGGPRNWQVVDGINRLNLRETRSVKAKVVFKYAPGTILDNLGCQKVQERTWCYVQKFGGGPVGYVAAEFLKPAVSPDGSVAKGADTSALRAGKGDFDARGTVPCAVNQGQPMTRCKFGVARAGGGDATVVINRTDGRKRVIFFRRGIAMGPDSSQADPASFRFKVTKESDLHMIRVGDERYEIPDAVIFGG
jgi:hypothetical protein